MEEVRDWYVANTGYVLQLATPYFEELTVRENLTLAAQIKLSKNYTQYEKFERVEQVMIVVSALATKSPVDVQLGTYNLSLNIMLLAILLSSSYSVYCII